MNFLSGSGLESLTETLRNISKTKTYLEQKYNIVFEDFRYDPGAPPPVSNAFANHFFDKEVTDTIITGMFGNNPETSMRTPVPFLGGYSDFFAIGGDIFADVAHYLGVLAAANIFAEVAIPTGLMHASENIKQSSDIGMRSDWSFSDRSVSEEGLAEEFASGLLLVHSVKLSRQSEYIGKVIHLLNAV
ncbi:hypothetical protein [Methylobacterium sp. 17Sr1-1]|uniref:hypothetical protein n=1 Tax=Methylobacterium sp. 17Sr1-1 TaxID=2202826 RepID=UPI0013A532A1|nr:hypothetical protein [Methylobacterium sp. 17Sr1-1]